MSYFLKREQTPTKAQVTEKPGPFAPAQDERKAPGTQPFTGEGQEVGGMEDASRTASGDPVTLKTVEAMQKLKLTLKKRGTHGIITLGRKFKSMDDDGSGSLDYAEFKKAMKEMDFNEGEYSALFRYFDRDCNGFISHNEFITGLRGSLNERRRDLVFQAFAVLDKDGSGVVEVKDLVGRYDAKNHPDVLSEKKTEFEVLREFMDTFDGGEKDGKITPTEFAQYYASVSANIDDDDYFELMIRNAWHISGGEGWCENTTNRRVLVTHEDGTQTIEEIKNDFDIEKDDEEAMKKNLAEQGIDAKHIDTTGNIEKPPAPQPTQPARPRSDRENNRAKMTQSSIVF